MYPAAEVGFGDVECHLAGVGGADVYAGGGVTPVKSGGAQLVQTKPTSWIGVGLT